MIKVKIFSDKDTDQLEAKINQWLAENGDKEIMEFVNGSTAYTVVISLFYQEPEPSAYESGKRVTAL